MKNSPAPITENDDNTNAPAGNNNTKLGMLLSLLDMEFKEIDNQRKEEEKAQEAAAAKKAKEEAAAAKKAQEAALKAQEAAAKKEQDQAAKKAEKAAKKAEKANAIQNYKTALIAKVTDANENSNLTSKKTNEVVVDVLEQRPPLSPNRNQQSPSRNGSQATILSHNEYLVEMRKYKTLSDESASWIIQKAKAANNANAKSNFMDFSITLAYASPPHHKENLEKSSLTLELPT